MRERARKLLESPRYQKALMRRLREGSAPMIEVLLYHYAYGKPVDRMRIEGTVGTVDLVEALQLAWGRLRAGGPAALSEGDQGDPSAAGAPPGA